MNSFLEIRNLLYLVNGGDTDSVTAVDETVTEILSTVFDKDDGPPSIMTRTFTPVGAAPVSYAPATIKIGELPAFDVPAGGGATFTDAAGFPDGVGGPMTLMVLVESPSPVPTQYLAEVKSSQNNLLGITSDNDSAEIKARVANGGFDPSVNLQADTPTVITLQWDMPATNDETVGDIRIFIDKNQPYEDGRSKPDQRPMERMSIFGSADNIISAGAKIGIVLHANAYLSETEIHDAVELITYWRENGSAPPAEVYPPNCSFQASTNDDRATLYWVHSTDQEADPETWVDVSTVSELNTSLSAFNGQANGQLNVNSATDLSAAGWVRCKAVAPYATKYSSPAQLEIRDQT